ncbi:type I-U CRISPR-associated RAMP protein Csb1/Cas7u [Haematomicrobium sanguinis]|uniref:type I-G CRISPR-associated RAMP protein Csb1/Cas7g n=1 Tax=Haematomicrobium sanguinis TaxID=479106 RepID=UPI0005511563|nr:type I-U CRISPR-associated RAMP protein Csb1/Cas7u [Haematomicrobium sanguinis]
MPTQETLTLDLLNQASRPGGPSALTATTHLAPAGGEQSLVAPAKYTARGQDGSVYLYEDRYLNGELKRTVLIDARTSVANRMEDALNLAIHDGHELLEKLPRVAVEYPGADGQEAITLTDTDLPHRLFDAHLRLATKDGQPVTATEQYRNARNATPGNAKALLDLSPISILFGSWDSTRKSNQVRFPSAIVGEIIGVIGDRQDEAAPTKRSGARIDPVGAKIQVKPEAAREIAETQKAEISEKQYKKLTGKRTDDKNVSGAELGLGAIPPSSEALDGIATSDIIRTYVLSFSTLRRLRFGTGPDGDAAIRALLAALAINAMVRNDSELNIRANCHLVETEEPQITLDLRHGNSATIKPLTIEDADQLLQDAYNQAKDKADIEWNGQVFTVQGNPAITANASDQEDQAE